MNDTPWGLAQWRRFVVALLVSVAFSAACFPHLSGLVVIVVMWQYWEMFVVVPATAKDPA